MLAAIWAQDENGLIGKEDRLPWRLPNDSKFFKQMTEANTLVMGRKTFEGMGSRPLPNRQTIVLTRDSSIKQKACMSHSGRRLWKKKQTVFSSLEGQLFIKNFCHFVRYYTVQSSIMYSMEMLIFHLLTGLIGH